MNTENAPTTLAQKGLTEIQNTTLDDVSAVIGFSATLRLSAWFGDGGNLYVPGTVEDGQLVVKLIGMAAAKALSKEWGYQHLSLPRASAYEQDQVKNQIGRMFEVGFGSREISRHLRMSERRVQQICRELEATGLITIVGAKSPWKNAPEKGPGKSTRKKAPRIDPEKGPSTFPPAFFGVPAPTPAT